MTNRTQPSADRLAAPIGDGASLAILKGPGGPLELVRAIIRRGVKNLHLITVPTGDIAADLLIGAGCVKSVETSGIALDEFGQAPAFNRAARSGAIHIYDSTCPALYSGLQAGQKGIPFLPIRGLVGSDVLANRHDYKVIDNPFETNDPIVAVPAIKPDFALIHVQTADRGGNLYVGDRPEVKMMASAARATLATTETITEQNLGDDPQMAAGTLSSLYVTAIAIAQNGAWPSALTGAYGIDGSHIAAYAQMARTEEGFATYLERFVSGEKRGTG